MVWCTVRRVGAQTRKSMRKKAASALVDVGGDRMRTKHRRSQPMRGKKGISSPFVGAFSHSFLLYTAPTRVETIVQDHAKPTRMPGLLATQATASGSESAPYSSSRRKRGVDNNPNLVSTKNNIVSGDFSVCAFAALATRITESSRTRTAKKDAPPPEMTTSTATRTPNQTQTPPLLYLLWRYMYRRQIVHHQQRRGRR